ncbi:MAG: protein kinase [Myxococcota bacterium]
MRDTSPPIPLRESEAAKAPPPARLPSEARAGSPAPEAAHVDTVHDEPMPAALTSASRRRRPSLRATAQETPEGTETPSAPPRRHTPASPSELEGRVGTLVGEKYRLDALLGQGGMGAVYAATNQWTRQRVALKFLLFGSRPQSRKRFFREAQAMGALDHPNIARVFDLGEDMDGGLFMVEELLEGEDLKSALDGGRKLGLKEACELLVPVMSGLSHAHGEGILHRDIKPGNLFLARDKRGRRVPKIIDFGIAKNVATPDSSSLTHGRTLGTPAYMSPEQAFGDESPGPAVDVWSLGAVLFRCLSGRAPYDAKGYAVLTQLSKADPPRLDAVAPEVPAAVADVVERALQRDARERTPSVGRLLGELLSAEAVATTPWGQTLLGRYGDEGELPEGWVPRPSAPAERSLGPALLVGALAVALIAGALGIVLGRSDEPAATSPAPEAPSARSLFDAHGPEWREALLAEQEPGGGFRGLPQLPVSAWSTGQAGAALFASHPFCAVPEGNRHRVLEALDGFALPYGYGSGGAGHDGLDVVATAWAALLYAQADVAGHERAGPVLERALRLLAESQRPDGSFRERPEEPERAYADAVATWALVEGARAGHGGADEVRERALENARRLLGEDATYEVAGLASHVAVGVLRARGLRASGPAEDAVLARFAARLLDECAFDGVACVREPVDDDSTSRFPTSTGQDQVQLAWMPWGALAAALLLADGGPPLDPELRERAAAYRDGVLSRTHRDAATLKAVGGFVLAEAMLTLALMSELPERPEAAPAPREDAR